jgi:hypothetical protein
VARQPDLFAASAAVDFDRACGGAQRHELVHGAWVEHVPGWVVGHGALFDALHGGLSWRAESRRMYDRVVETPRLLARVPQSGPGSR